MYILSNKLSGLLLSLYITNVYGADVLSPFVYALTTSMLLCNIFTYPVNISAMKLYSDKKNRSNVFYSQIIFIIILGLIAWIISLSFFDFFSNSILLFFIVSIDLIADNYMQQQKLSKEISFFSRIRLVVFLLLIVIFHFIEMFNIHLYSFFLLLFALSKVLYVENKSLKSRLKIFKIWRAWDFKRTIGPLFICRVMISASQLALFTLIYGKVSLIESAALGIAFQLKSIVDFLTNAISKSSLPYFLEANANKLNLLKKTQLISICMGLCLLLFFYLSIDYILLLYGDNKILSFHSQILHVLAGSCFALMSSVFSNYIISENKEKLLILQNISWLTVYLISFFMIGSFDLDAISQAWLISYVAYLLLNLLLIKRIL